MRTRPVCRVCVISIKNSLEEMRSAPRPERHRLLDRVAGRHAHPPPFRRSVAGRLDVVIRAFGVPGEDDLHAVHHHVRARRAVGVVTVENNDDLFAGIAA